MNKEMERVIEILESMGAKNVYFTEKVGFDDSLAFEFNGETVELSGLHYNDSTGGIGATIKST